MSGGCSARSNGHNGRTRTRAVAAAFANWRGFCTVKQRNPFVISRPGLVLDNCGSRMRLPVVAKIEAFVVSSQSVPLLLTLMHVVAPLFRLKASFCTLLPQPTKNSALGPQLDLLVY